MTLSLLLLCVIVIYVCRCGRRRNDGAAVLKRGEISRFLFVARSKTIANPRAVFSQPAAYSWTCARGRYSHTSLQCPDPARLERFVSSFFPPGSQTFRIRFYSIVFFSVATTTGRGRGGGEIQLDSPTTHV